MQAGLIPRLFQHLFRRIAEVEKAQVWMFHAQPLQRASISASCHIHHGCHCESLPTAAHILHKTGEIACSAQHVVVSCEFCVQLQRKRVAAEGHPAAELHLQSELPGDLPGSAHSSLRLLAFCWNRIHQLHQRLQPDMDNPGQHTEILKLPSMCRRHDQI